MASRTWNVPLYEPDHAVSSILPNFQPTVLFVCTGNICRSPFMEAYFRKLITSLEMTEIRVLSAGTGVTPEHPLDETMVEVFDIYGILAHGFRAKKLTKSLINEATLIVTAETFHRSAVIRLSPSAHAKVFTLLQSERLLAHRPGARYTSNDLPALSAVTVAMARARGVAGPSGGYQDGIPDPWQRPLPVHQKAAALMSKPLQALAIEIAAVDLLNRSNL